MREKGVKNGAEVGLFMDIEQKIGSSKSHTLHDTLLVSQKLDTMFGQLKWRRDLFKWNLVF
jgi:hypothetical protein